MTPKCVHAYSVSPSKDRLTPVSSGGPVIIHADLSFIFTKNISVAKFESKICVDFVFDNNRENEIRRLVMDFIFGDDDTKSKSSKQLANRLSLAMDGRSKAALFLIAQHEKTTAGSVSLWLFPSDEAFRLSVKTESIDVAVVKDIFSNTSYLRKAALFEGQNVKADFLSGRVLDFQSMSSEAEVAKHWVEKFLNCSLSVTSESGNKILAQALKKIAVETDDNALQSKITNAAIAIKDSPLETVTFQHIHDNFIPKELQKKFTRAVGGQKMMMLSFKKSEHLLSNYLGLNVYKLDTGVSIVAPLSEIGNSVIIKIDGDRRLTCTGNVTSERLKAKHVAASN